MANRNIQEKSISLKEEIESLLLDFTEIISQQKTALTTSIFNSEQKREKMESINRLEIIEGELEKKILDLSETVQDNGENLLGRSISDYFFFKNYLEYSRKMKDAISEYLELEKKLARGALYSFLHSKALGNSYRKVMVSLKEASELKKRLTAKEDANKN